MPTNSVMHLILQLVALTLINTMYPKCCVQDLRPFWSVCLENSAVGSSSESWDPRGPASPLSWTFLPATGKRACMHREGMFQNLVPVYCFLAFHFILIKLSVPYPFFLQRDRHERSDPGKRTTSWPPHLQKNVMLYHARWHATATSNNTRGNDGVCQHLHNNHKALFLSNNSVTSTQTNILWALIWSLSQPNLLQDDIFFMKITSLLFIAPYLL